MFVGANWLTPIRSLGHMPDLALFGLVVSSSNYPSTPSLPNKLTYHFVQPAVLLPRLQQHLTQPLQSEWRSLVAVQQCMQPCSQCLGRLKPSRRRSRRAFHLRAWPQQSGGMRQV